MSLPDLAGKVMTVKGPIDPDRLGITLMHEHLFVAIYKSNVPDENTPVTELAPWDQKVTLGNLHLVKERKPIADNRVLSDERVAVDEAMEFRNAGGGTIVEVTSIGIRRDPMALLRVSKATGLNVVMGAGWYQKMYHPANMDERTVEDLSGIIGEVGVRGEPIEPNEVKSIQASVRASRAIGAAITLHLGGVGREKLQTIGIMADEGGDLSRVIFGHSDAIAGDMPLMQELLSHGVYLEFDLLGRTGVPLDFKPVRDDGLAGFLWAGTALVADAVPKLIDAGYADRILLSQDVCTKVALKRYGGTGYSYVLEKFLPHLRAKGVADEDIQMMMVENPKRVLTLAAPSAT